ncbi:hypothetical protein [Fredinandcohnia sp. 179-A 10B2 NHS]|uniref:hypothetical protein n=1 Tax=Fredinandcohnia sp. 179-A 10B2 NHS TaxID=3235176 RepID=UPI0039A2351E
MTDKILRSFASGLLVAASVCALVYFVGPDKTNTTKAEEKPTVEEMTKLLQADGYVVHTETEWNELTAAVQPATEEKTEEKKEATEDTTTEKKAEEPREEVFRTVVTVSEGMTSFDVGKALVSANIIEDAWDFTFIVEDKGVAKYLKLGTYEIDSTMTTDEIISKIFNR